MLSTLLSGASSSGYAFQGREWDSEIALYYFRARYYNSAAGSWASDDPIGFTAGTNFTQFVSNNPVRFTDPFGLCSTEDGQQLEFKPGTTEEEKRLIREALSETTSALEMAMLAASLAGTGGTSSLKNPKLVVKTLAQLEATLSSQVARTPNQIAALQKVMQNAGIKGPGGTQIMQNIPLRDAFGQLTDDAKWAANVAGTEIHYWIHKVTSIAYGFKLK